MKKLKKAIIPLLTAFTVSAATIPTAQADDYNYINAAGKAYKEALKKAFKEGQKNAKTGKGSGKRAELKKLQYTITS